MSGSLDTLLKEMPFEEVIRVANAVVYTDLSYIKTIEDWKNLDRSVKEKVLAALQRRYREEPFTTWPTFSKDESNFINRAINKRVLGLGHVPVLTPIAAIGDLYRGDEEFRKAYDYIMRSDDVRLETRHIMAEYLQISDKAKELLKNVLGDNFENLPEYKNIKSFVKTTLSAVYRFLTKTADMEDFKYESRENEFRNYLYNDLFDFGISVLVGERGEEDARSTLRMWNHTIGDIIYLAKTRIKQAYEALSSI